MVEVFTSRGWGDGVGFHVIFFFLPNECQSEPNGTEPNRSDLIRSDVAVGGGSKAVCEIHVVCTGLVLVVRIYV